MKKLLVLCVTVATIVVAGIVAVVLLVVPKQTSEADDLPDGVPTAQATDDSRSEQPRDRPDEPVLPTECGSRLVNLHDVIDADVFAACILAAHTAANTMHSIWQSDDGGSGEGWYQVEPRRMYAVIAGDDEARILDTEHGFWYYGDGRWSAAVAGSSDPGEVMAHTLAQLLRPLADPEVGIQAWASGDGYRLDSLLTETVNGVSTRRYSGLPDSWIDGVELTDLKVWLDNDYRVIRSVGTATGFGFTVTTQSDYLGWGKPVDIPDTPDHVQD